MGKTRIIAETGRRPARRRHRHRGGPLRPPVRGLPGGGRRRAAGAERLPDAAPRGAGHPGHRGLGHAQGRDERGAARLGHQRPRDPLHHRLGRRPAPLPGDGPRLPVGDRPRGARAVLEVAGRLPDAVVACVGGGSNAMGIFSAFLDDPSVKLIGVEAAGHGLDLGEARRLAREGAARRAPRLAQLRAPGRRRPDRRGPLDQRRARLPGRRARAGVPQGHRPADPDAGDRRRGARRLPVPVAHRGDHPGAGERPRGLRGAEGGAAARRGTG